MLKGQTLAVPRSALSWCAHPWRLAQITFAIASAMTPAHGGAQVVAITHPSSGDQPAIDWYRREHAEKKQQLDGRNLQTIAVTDGGTVCVSIADANTFLYNYSVTTDATKPSTPTGLGDLLARMSSLPVSALPAVPAGQAAQPVTTTYAGTVDSLAVMLPKALASLISGSDNALRPPFKVFKDVVDSAQRIVDAMDRVDARAESLYRSGKTAPLTPPEALDPLHAAELLGRATHGTMKTIVSSAAKGLRDICLPIKSHPTTLVLNIKSLRPDSVKTARAVKDSILSFVAEPHDAAWAKVEIGTFIVPTADGRKAFTAASGSVQFAQDTPLETQIASFLEVRTPGNAFWLALGVGTTTAATTPSYFFGVDWKPSDVVGPKYNASLGVGLVYELTTIGLTKGATVGMPLPAGLALNDVLQKARRFGVGVMFSVSGFAFSP